MIARVVGRFVFWIVDRVPEAEPSPRATSALIVGTIIGLLIAVMILNHVQPS